MKSASEIAADFDGIAAALRAAARADQLTPAESFLFEIVPSVARTALDVGCGDGRLSRVLASRGLSVVGIDLSPGMIELARSKTSPGVPAEFRVGDVMAECQVGRQFDVVVCVAVLHHFPAELMIPRLRSFVAPGGVLLLQDVVSRSEMRYLWVNLRAVVRVGLRRIASGTRSLPKVRKLYKAHGLGETYLSPQSIRPRLEPLLPGVEVVDHLEWRYSAIWRAPVA